MTHHLVRKITYVGLSAIIASSLALPALAQGNGKGENGNNGNGKSAIVHSELGNNENEGGKSSAKVSSSVLTNQQAYTAAIHKANSDYNAALKAARSAYKQALKLAKGNKTARKAAQQTYQAALRAARLQMQQAKATARAILLGQPVANAQSVTVMENATSTITLTATAKAGATLTYSIVTNPSHGTLSGTAPALTYIPNANYVGPDSFTFKVNDGTKDSAAATVSITVAATTNQPPIANAQSITVNENATSTITLTGSDPESATTTYSVVTNPAHGTLSGTAPVLSYRPDTNYSGLDSFTFKVNDGSLDSAIATVSITVAHVNQAPVSLGQTVTTPTSTPVVINLSGSDVDGCSAGTYGFSAVTGPTHGIVAPTSGSAVCSSGTLTAGVLYTPTLGFTGSDSFVFKFNDGLLDSNTSTVAITVGL